MRAWNSTRYIYGGPIPVGYAFKRSWEGGHSGQSQHYAGVAFDVGQRLSNAQRNAIRNAVNSLYEAKESLAMGMTMDAITVSLQETIDYLLELTGEKAGEEIVDSVFHNFCVGK